MNHVDVVAKSTEYCFQGSAFNIRSFLLCMSTLRGGGGSGQYLLNPFLIKPGIVLNHVPQCYWKSFNVLKVTGFTRSKKKKFLKTGPYMAFG